MRGGFRFRGTTRSSTLAPKSFGSETCHYDVQPLTLQHQSQSLRDDFGIFQRVQDQGTNRAHASGPVGRMCELIHDNVKDGNAWLVADSQRAITTIGNMLKDGEVL